MTIQDIDETPVLFRVSRAPKKHGSEVTAVFPCLPADYDGWLMTCYAHIGQHGSCGIGWYRSTRPAMPAEYADLKAGLESIGYKLRVYQRINSRLRAKYRANLRAA